MSTCIRVSEREKETDRQTQTQPRTRFETLKPLQFGLCCMRAQARGREGGGEVGRGGRRSKRDAKRRRGGREEKEEEKRSDGGRGEERGVTSPAAMQYM
eukprot:3353692-Rhodomonas_salina.2